MHAQHCANFKIHTQFRYRYIHLSPHWYASGSGKRVNSGKAPAKRKHRRTHGKISFLDLSKRIAERWANLEANDKATMTYVRKIAARELEGYKRKMKLFKDNGVVPVEACLSCDAGKVSTPEKLSAKNNSSEHMPVTPPSPAKSVKFEESVKFNQQQAKKAKQDAKREREDQSVSGSGSDSGIGMGDFAFHPVPTSYWRKRKNKAAKTGKDKPSLSKMARHAPYASNRYKGMHSASSRRSNPKDEEYIRSNFNKPEFASARTDFESEMNSFLSHAGEGRGRGNDPVPSVNFSPDDVSGLIKVLSDGEE